MRYFHSKEFRSNTFAPKLEILNCMKKLIANKYTLEYAASHENIGPSSMLILNEAQQRGIRIEMISGEKGLFKLHYGDKTIFCNRSLTEFTSVIANEICIDKRLTSLILKKAGIKVPDQALAADPTINWRFFNKHKRVVIKPLNESLGRGVSVDVRTFAEMEKTIKKLKVSGDEDVLIEEYVEGEDLRILVINYKFTAAIHRTLPTVTGNGKSTILELIAILNTHKPSHNQIPFNYETKRCIRLSRYRENDILPTNLTIPIRKNTNEHTGGIPTDATNRVSSKLRKVAEKVARTIGTPVVGIDFLVSEIDGEKYSVIEANGRPGLDGHEPQPVVERFMDFLFPETIRLLNAPKEELNIPVFLPVLPISKIPLIV